MHIVVIAWLYVALMMAVAEGTHATGTVIGAIFTFLLYGVAPVALVVYLMNAPVRRRRIKEREAIERENARIANQMVGNASSGNPDARSKSSTDAITSVRKET